MNCQQKLHRLYNYVDCGEFLFIDKKLSYEDSVYTCKDHGYGLAFVNIESGKAVEGSFNLKLYKELKFLGLDRKFYRIGLRFLQESSGWLAKWSNSTVDDKIIIDDIKEIARVNFDDVSKVDRCYDVVIQRNLESIFRVGCDITEAFVCRTQVDIPNTRPTQVTTATITSSTENYDVTNAANTKTNLNTGSALIGLSAMFSIFFFAALILLAFYCYKKRKENSLKTLTEKSQNVAVQSEAGYGSIYEAVNDDKSKTSIRQNGIDQFKPKSIYCFDDISEIEKSQKISDSSEAGSLETYECMEGSIQENSQNVEDNFEARHDSTNELNKDDSVYLEMKFTNDKTNKENYNDDIYATVHKN